MILRRLLLMTLVILFVSGLAAQIAGPPAPPGPTERTDTTATGTSPEPGSGRPSARPGDAPSVAGGAREISLRVRERGAPARERIEVAGHVVVSVESPEPGQVEIEGLGRIAAIDPGTPAVFDLLPERTGRYEVVFTPLSGQSRAVAVLLVDELD